MFIWTQVFSCCKPLSCSQRCVSHRRGGFRQRGGTRPLQCLSQIAFLQCSKRRQHWELAGSLSTGTVAQVCPCAQP